MKATDEFARTDADDSSSKGAVSKLRDQAVSDLHSSSKDVQDSVPLAQLPKLDIVRDEDAPMTLQASAQIVKTLPEIRMDVSSISARSQDKDVTWARSSNPDSLGFASWDSGTGETLQARLYEMPDGSHLLQARNGDLIVLLATGHVHEMKGGIQSFDDFRNYVQKRFNEWDADDSGGLSRAELVNAAGDKPVFGSEAQALAALNLHRERMLSVHKDESTLKPEVTRADIDDLMKLKYNPTKPSYQALDQADKNKDELLTKAELRQYNEDHKDKQLSESTFDEIDAIDGKLHGQLDLTSVDEQVKVHKLPRLLMAAVEKVREISESLNTLYSPGDNLREKITPEGIEQGKLNDCYLLAGVASLSLTEKGRVQSHSLAIGQLMANKTEPIPCN